MTPEDINLIKSGVGGVTGAASGAYGAYQKNKSTRNELNAQLEESKKLQELIAQMQSQGTAEAGAAYAPQLAGYEGNLQDYLGKLQNTDYSQFNLTKPEEFSFDMNKATQEEMNPQLQAIIDRSVQGDMTGAAAGGSLFSGSTGKDIARTTADIQAKEWDAARGRAANQQQSKYQQYTDKWNQNKDIASANKSNLNSGIANQGTAVGLQQGAWDAKRGEINTLNTNANQNTLLNTQAAGASRAQLKGLPSNLSAMLSGGLGGLASGLGAK